MAGEQKRKERKVLITKALLLGYTIAWCDVDKAFGLWDPEGRRVRNLENVGTLGRGWSTPNWPAPWMAAEKALELAGVILHAKNVRRDKGIGSSKSWKLRQRRNLRGRFKGLFEGSGSS